MGTFFSFTRSSIHMPFIHTLSHLYTSFTYLSSTRLHPLIFHPHTLSFHTPSFPSTYFFNSQVPFPSHALQSTCHSSTHFLVYILVLHIPFIHKPSSTYFSSTHPFIPYTKFSIHTVGFPFTYFFNSIGTFSFTCLSPLHPHTFLIYIPVLHIPFIHIPFPFAYPTLPPHFFHSHTFHLCISFHPLFLPTPTIPTCCMHHMSPRFFTNEPTPSLSLFLTNIFWLQYRLA